MPFTSPLFLFLFLPLSLAGFAVAGARFRTIVLLALSLVFYTWGAYRSLPLLLAYVVANYLLGRLVARHRDGRLGSILLWSAVALNITPLAWYKCEGIAALPLGISYFTLVAIAYVVDVHREEAEPERSLPRFALFLSLFPKITAGPITRYNEVAPSLPGGKLVLRDFAKGVRRFTIGLGKKVLLADTIAHATDPIFALPQSDLTTGLAWLGIGCYTLQIYLDFSGYTDMAIGLGKMFGFTFPENFNYPYTSRSLTEFWRRWHMTLSFWLRDYLFIPLSYALITEGVRKKIGEGRYRTNYRAALAIFVVFTLCGLWHGTGYGFITWGMLNGVVLAVEMLWLGKKLATWKSPLQHAYLLLMVMMAWVLFRTPDIGAALHYYKALLGFTSATAARQPVGQYMTTELLVALAVGTLAAVPTARWISRLFDIPRLRALAPVAETAFLVAVLLASFALLAGSTYAPFIYQQF